MCARSLVVHMGYMAPPTTATFRKEMPRAPGERERERVHHVDPLRQCSISTRIIIILHFRLPIPFYYARVLLRSDLDGVFDGVSALPFAVGVLAVLAERRVAVDGVAGADVADGSGESGTQRFGALGVLLVGVKEARTRATLYATPCTHTHVTRHMRQTAADARHHGRKLCSHRT